MLREPCINGSEIIQRHHIVRILRQRALERADGLGWPPGPIKRISQVIPSVAIFGPDRHRLIEALNRLFSLPLFQEDNSQSVEPL
jgi:hypothetical protein